MLNPMHYDTLKFELEQRIRQSERLRQARPARVTEQRRLTRVRWTLGSALLRLGAAVQGENRLR